MENAEHHCLPQEAEDSAQLQAKQQEVIDHQELKAITEELGKENDKATTMTSDGLALLHNKEVQTATVVIKIPEQSELYALTNKEINNAKQAFQVFASSTHGQYKVIHFNYSDKNLLPENAKQAIFLLYSPYLKNQSANYNGPAPQCPLNQAQKNAIYKDGESNRQKDEQVKPTELQAALVKKATQKEGLLGSTKVKTEKGYSKLEDLKVGDTIACYDAKNQKQSYSKITYVDRIQIEKHIQITINNQIIKVASDHQFYIKDSEAWITAKDLENHPELINLVDPNIKEVKEVNEKLDVLRICVDSNHNFYITDHNILVHNYIPIVFEGLILWEIGEGITFTWAILGPTIIAAVTGLIYGVVNKGTGSEHHGPELNRLENSCKNPTKPAQEISFQANQANNNQNNQNSQKVSNDSGTPQPSKDPENKENKKTVEDVLRDTTPGKETRGKSEQFEKPGDYDEAIKDFESLKPSNVRDISKGDKLGKAGDLPDGRSVNVRNNSKDSRPTLEVINLQNMQRIKVRYGSK